METARGGEKLRLRFLNPPNLGARYVVYPGAETYRPYLQVDRPRAEAVVVVTICEFGEAAAEAVSLQVAGGLVDLSCRVSGDPHRILLTLVGEKGQSPRLKVSQGQRIVLDRPDLTVPPGTRG